MEKLNIITKIHALSQTKKWPHITYFCLLLIFVLLNIKVIYEPYLMMEDGFVFINGIIRDGIKSFAFTYGGYICIASRLISLISFAFGKIFNSVIIEININTIISMLIVVYIINLINTKNFDFISYNKTVRFIYSIVLLLLSTNFLSIMYTNLSMNWWSGVYLSFWVLLLLNNQNPNLLDYIFMIIAILSTPFSFIIMIPLFIKITNYKNIKNYKKGLIKYGIFFCVILIQVFAILTSKNVDAASSVSLTTGTLIQLFKYTICMCFMSMNYILTPLSYGLLINNHLLAIFNGLIIYLLIIYISFKEKKFKYIISLSGITFIIYFLTLYKNSADINYYYHYIVNEQYLIWYHFIPALLALIMFFTVIEKLFINKQIKMITFLLGVVVSVILIKNYYKPDLDYVDNIYNVEKYVDYKSKYYTCISTPPKWVDWCVLVPIEKNKCEEGLYECSEKI